MAFVDANRDEFGVLASEFNGMLDQIEELNDMHNTLTEALAMTPAASVSGFYLSHPDSTYFTLGKIGQDQVDDMVARSGEDRAFVERALAPNL